MKTIHYLLLGASLLFITTSFSAPGNLDLTFGGTGKFRTDFSAGADTASAVALRSDGKIIVVGTSQPNLSSSVDVSVACYNADGSLSSAFGSSGKVRTDVSGTHDFATCVAVQPDDKVLVGGNAMVSGIQRFFLLRYTATGSLDTSFGNGGIVFTLVSTDGARPNSIALEGNGRIVLAGFADFGASRVFALARYNSDGSLDTTFGNGGKVTTTIGSGSASISGMALQSDGKIAVTGPGQGGNFLLARYQTNGTLDPTFGSGGKVIHYTGGSAVGVVIQGDGKIVAAGKAYGSTLMLARYNANGTLDTGFGGSGLATKSLTDLDVSRVALQTDGKIIVSGGVFGSANGQFAVFRYTANGTLDLGFGSSGYTTTDFGSANDYAHGSVIQPDGRIVLVGAGDGTDFSSTDFGIARYEGDPPFSAWKLTHLGDANSPDLGDPDGDGILTLAEYGLNLLPETPSTIPAVSALDYAEGRRLRMLIQRDPSHNDVTVEVQAAGSVSGPWTTVATSTLGSQFTGLGYVSGDSATTGVKTIEIRDIVNISDSTARFLRVKVTH